MEEALLWCVCSRGELLPIAMWGICTRWRADWIRLAITTCCNITQSHLECILWLKDLYSCKIMTKNILVNSARGRLKTKSASLSFNWYFGWCNPIEQVWDKPDWKVRAKQNYPQAWFTSSSSRRKAGQNIFSLLWVFGGKNAENLLSSQRWSFWWIFFFFFFFFLYLMWLSKACI